MSEIKVRKHKDGLAFYIDGSLQFDTCDERIYHESLVLPAASLVQGRFRKPVTALVLGGGDGLALRELLKYREVAKADLVDYDPEVIALGRGLFSRYNEASLSDSRVTVKCADARDFLRTAKQKYDIVLADFTFPCDLPGCSLFTEDFFRQVGGVLSRRGLFALNAVSPEKFSPAYWAIYKTLRAAGLYPRPLSAEIPSFSSHGYGKWGFFFSSPRAITGRELAGLRFPASSAFLTPEKLHANMKFDKASVLFGTGVSKPVEDPSDLLALLNLPEPAAGGGGALLDFFLRSNRNFAAGGFPGDPALWSAETLAAWEDRITGILRTFDWEQLIAEAGRLSGDVSSRIREELAELKEELPSLFSGAGSKAERVYRILAVLSLLLIMINMAYPDNAFAKGYSSGGGSSADIVFISSKAPSPFHGMAFQLMSRPTGVVPDSGGAPHPKKTVTFTGDYSSPAAPGAPAASEQFLYAVTDNIQITASGNIFMTLFPLPYFLKLEPGRFVLLKEGSSEPLFKFRPDPALVQSLSGNISGQISAVGKALADHRKWLAWAGPSGLLLPPIAAESVEARNLTSLKLALEKAAEKLAAESAPGKIPAAGNTPPVPGAADDTQILAAAKSMGFTKPRTDTITLMPGLYLTGPGSLIMMREDGDRVTYVLPGLLPDDDAVVMRPTRDLTAFMRALLVQKAASLPTGNPGRWIGEMDDNAYNKLISQP